MNSPALSKARAEVAEADIRIWFKALHENLSEMNALDILDNPERIFNTDETCIQLLSKKM